MADVTERTPLTWARLHYRGDLCGRIEGQVVGPNRMGELFVIVATEFDAATGLTLAKLAYATTEDVAAARAAS